MGLIELRNIIKATQNPEKKIKTMSKIKIGNISKSSNNGRNWIGVGTAIGAAVFAATNEPVWIAIGVAIGAALGLRKPKNQNED
tara:strand:+ start:31 stop:282 length:252 start_codon:yes stop_codon:yes gene_type:complete